MSIKNIEAYGVERMLAELRQELIRGRYRPQPARRVFIPKPDGRMRPLSIPAVKDRVVQMAASLSLSRSLKRTLKTHPLAFGPEEARVMHWKLYAKPVTGGEGGW